MRIYLLIICVVLSSRLLPAQNDIIVLHLSGKAFYYPPQESASQAIHPGLRLSVDGKMRCLSGASVKLLYDGETFTVSDGKVRRLSELVQQSKGGSGLNFAGRFWSFLTGSMKETKDEKALEENHRRYMEAAYAGVKGYARQQHAIQSSLLYNGRMSDAPVSFQWSGTDEKQISRFEVTRKSDGKAMASVHVRGNLFQLDFRQLALDPGAAYEWAVLPADETADGPWSAETTFEYAPDGPGKVFSDLKLLKEYKDASPAEQLLMQAYSLENAGFFYDAFEKYSAAATAYPTNLLVRDVRAAFLSRMGMLEEAKAIITN
jgi:hypothetical protein